MDKPEAIDSRSLYDSNEYPELDLNPTYLWVGEAADHPCHNINFPSDGSSHQPIEPQCENLTESDPEKNSHFRTLDSIASEDSQEKSWRQFSVDIDPDFESPENCSTQVFSFSRIVASY